MTNRSALALAVATGYVLGRTKKAKLAIGVGGMVLAKRLDFSPQQLVGTFAKQVLKDPKLAEVGKQLRGDAQGVGKAMTSALVTRRLDSLADNLHGRTLQVRDRLDPTGSGDEGGDAPEGEAADEAGNEQEEPGKPEGKAAGAAKSKASAPRKRAAKSASSATRPARSAAKKSTAARGKQAGKTAGKTATKTAKRTAARSGGGGGGEGGEE